MHRITILGSGMVGKAMAVELAKKNLVTSADIDKNALESLSGKPNLKTLVLDVRDEAALASAIKDSDLVISAVPGFLGLKTMEQVIKNKKDLVDISFLPEDVLYLDPVAKANGVTVIMDCGVAPGLPNYVAGYQSTKTQIDEMTYMVGGLPKVRNFPFEYKTPFSPCDVIEEYTRPARCVQNGKIVIKPPMSDPEYVDFEKTGTLEAFNTDGLRSLLYTMNNIPDMKEKTLRYPGHISLIKALKASGFFDREEIEVNGSSVVPFDFTSNLLFKAWKPDPNEPEFTIMRIILTVTEGKIRKEIIYDLYDEFDNNENVSSMARTTGFTATGTAEMILDKVFTEKGVLPPELVGKRPGCFEFIIGYLKERRIELTITERTI